jgi:outer membrane protein OmpA-like peptidoglycan-associated protein/tetratricopeptide (TPR) repeat protein
MKNIIISLLFAMLFVSMVKPQEDNNLKELFNDGEYFFALDDYNEAFPSYLKIYESGYQHNAMINYRLGICCLNIDEQKKNAPTYLEESVKNVLPKFVEVSLKVNSAPVDAYLYLGNAYRINNELDKALGAYQAYLKKANVKDQVSIQFTNQEIKACSVAKEMMAKPVNVSITNLGKPINSALSQYNPVVNDKEDVLVYMESQKFYEGVFFSRKIDGNWAQPINITPDIGSDGDLTVSSLSSDGNHLLLSKDDQFNSDIYECSYIDGNWQKNNKLKSATNTKYWESNASVSPDGKVMYFASNRSGGYGGMDIYKVELDATTGQWGQPVNLGPEINSQLNEDCPVILSDNKTLCFSSQGHYNMGGFDLFYSKMDDKGKWGEPQNMGYPINTTDDDLNYYPLKGGNVVYITRFLQGGLGKKDIYRIEKLPSGILSRTVDTLTSKDQDLANLKAVTDKGDMEKTPAILSDVNGVPTSKDKEHTKDQSVAEEKIPEVAIKEEKKVIRPVFFEYDKYTLSQTEKEKISQFAKYLKGPKDFIIEVIGNTDSKGNEVYNQKLSEKRAAEVRKYLIEYGIPSENIIVKGLGKTKPVAKNVNDDGSDNPLGRKLNRRVDFNIPKDKSENIIIEKVDVPDHLQIKK